RWIPTGTVRSTSVPGWPWFGNENLPSWRSTLIAFRRSVAHIPRSMSESPGMKSPDRKAPSAVPSASHHTAPVEFIASTTRGQTFCFCSSVEETLAMPRPFVHGQPGRRTGRVPALVAHVHGFGGRLGTVRRLIDDRVRLRLGRRGRIARRRRRVQHLHPVVAQQATRPVVRHVDDDTRRSRKPHRLLPCQLSASAYTCTPCG